MFPRLLIPFGYLLSQRRKILRSTATANGRVSQSLSSESCAAGPRHVPERNLVPALVLRGSQLHQNNWVYACLAVFGSWIGAFASMTFLHRPVREAPSAQTLGEAFPVLSVVETGPGKLENSRNYVFRVFTRLDLAINEQ
jgi:hypothetical protein